jgi:hypothetical protein
MKVYEFIIVSYLLHFGIYMTSQALYYSPEIRNRILSETENDNALSYLRHKFTEPTMMVCMGVLFTMGLLFFFVLILKSKFQIEFPVFIEILLVLINMVIHYYLFINLR